MYLGLDPGRDKVGFAFVNEEGELLCSGIFQAESFEAFLSALIGENWDYIGSYKLEGSISALFGQKLEVVLLGGGTTFKDFEQVLQRNGIRYEIVDESFTTLRARKAYFQIHPPKGLRRCIPSSLLIPKRDVDDLAAWELVKKWLQNKDIHGGVSYGF